MTFVVNYNNKLSSSEIKMGGKVAKNINAHPTFCAASSDETDRLKYLFDLKDFGETKEKRFDYVDDLLNDNEEL